MNLPLYKKLNVLFRVEPGCLGPNGKLYIEGFCKYAKQEISALDSEYIRWSIIPRYDKSLPEMEYKIKNKKITQRKAKQYLAVFNQKLDNFEEHLQDKLATLIDEFLSR